MSKFDLDTNLLWSVNHREHDYSGWTIRDAVEGVQIFGGIGSGKTSGSGRTFALKYLAHGFGGLVLSAKADEKDMWVQYCRETNRLNDLVIIEPGGNHVFNFLDYESTARNGKIPYTQNIVQVLKTVIKASQDAQSGKGNEEFWDTSLDLLIINSINLCQLAHGRINVQELYDIVTTAPKVSENGKDIDNANTPFEIAFKIVHKKVGDYYKNWKASWTDEQKKKYEKPYVADNDLCDLNDEARTFRTLDNFFNVTFKHLTSKTRSIIDFMFTGFLFRLLQEPVFSLFCRPVPSTVTPDDCLNGKIILLNLPVKQYNKVGRDCQILFKYIWQRAMEKRNTSLNNRPVFLWSDEAQHFIHEHDSEYQATARSSIIATVYLTQNLPNYYACMSGDKFQYRVKGFLGTLGTKIFHANADIETNTYASDLIGQEYRDKVTKGIQLAGEFGANRNVAPELVKMIRPEQFAQLANGSARNNFVVQAVIHKQGNVFSNGLSFKKVEFDQNYKITPLKNNAT